MEKHYVGLVRYLTAKLQDRNQAADVAHDAYIRVLETRGHMSLEFPQAFLYRTALNLTVDLHRRRVARRAESLDDVQDIAAEESLLMQAPQESLYHLQRVEILQRALNELQENTRQAFLLRKLDGLGHDEIAAQMGISKAMVEKHIVNAMKFCRVRVKEMERLN
ncbi:sigma-70 family RNA polymerase sigma factor [Salmonella enterica]|nr:sigma-70 family RNA polymerase sigma factor [Salmonella enterica]